MGIQDMSWGSGHCQRGLRALVSCKLMWVRAHQAGWPQTRPPPCPSLWPGHLLWPSCAFVSAPVEGTLVVPALPGAESSLGAL